MAEVWDYIIVGAGSAGCVLAERLSRDPGARVLLVEAGGPDRDLNIRMPLGLTKLVPPGVSPHNWEYWTAPQARLGGRRLYWPRGRVLGGSSSINAMVYIRGHATDYDRWRQLGCTGWGWSDVLPYFLRAENSDRGPSEHHGTGGPLHTSRRCLPNPLIDAFLAAGAELSLPATDDFNGPAMEGLGRYDSTTHNGERWSAARAYLHPALKRPNLRVMTGALAQRIVFENGRAAALVAQRDGVSETHRAAGEIILSGGAINSPQLLMLSGIGPGDHLQEMGIPVVRDLPGVGANLQDHIDVTLKWTCRVPIGLHRHSMGLPKLLTGLHWMLNRGGVAGYIPTPAGAFLKSRPELDAPDLQLHFMCLLSNPERNAELATHGYQIHVCHLRPDSRGTIRLASPDPAAHPIIDPNYLSADSDREALMAGVDVTRRIGNAQAFAPYRDREVWPGTGLEGSALVDAVLAAAETLYHPVGTARMGSDPDSVVDLSLKVRGVEGLRVVDASVMPVLISGNTNAPTMMIADKAADAILTEQKRFAA